jgi:hypothetical protein
MKTVNADYGIDSVPAQQEKHTWYRWHKFPLVPIIDVRSGDEWNCPSFSLSWLWFRVWSLEHAPISIEVSIDDPGMGAGLILPYLRIWVWILPLPWGWLNWARRKPKAQE